MGNVDGKVMVRSWWLKYMYAARGELGKRPYGPIVQSGEFVEQALKEGSNCERCRVNMDSQLREFTALFAGEVDRAVSSVRLEYGDL